MLNRLPTEIVTEILLYLPLLDLIQLLKANRRIYSIAIHEHSLMKYRINKRFSKVKLISYPLNSIPDMHQRPKVIHHVILEVELFTIHNGRIVKNPFSIVFNTPCCPDHLNELFNKINERELIIMYIAPHRFFRMAECTCGYRIIVKDPNDITKCVMEYLVYIAEFYSIVHKFSLVGFNDEMWREMKTIFNQHEICRSEVSVNIKLQKYSSYEVCESRLFNYGIDRIVIAGEKPTATENIQLHPRVFEANSVEILNPQGSISDEQLSKMECRELKLINQNITKNGLALLIKNIYDDAVCGERRYEVRMNKYLKKKHLFPFVPKSAYKKIRPGVIEMTNKYEQKFLIHKNDNGVWFKLISVDD